MHHMFSCESVVMIQMRNVPPELHALLKGRATANGMNLSGFLKEQLARMASLPTKAEILARVEADRETGLLPRISAEEIVAGVREDRDSR